MSKVGGKARSITEKLREASEFQTPDAQAAKARKAKSKGRAPTPPLTSRLAGELLSIPDDELTAEMCRKSLFEFVKEFWDEIIPDTPYYNWHMPFICAVLQEAFERVIRREPKRYDVIINVPPGTSKSTLVTIMAPAWAWTRDPTLRFITGAYSGDLAAEHNEKARQVIKSEKYQRLFPEIRISKSGDNKTHYKNTRTGERMRTSTGGTATGMHAHIIIVDDPLNPKQAASEKELQAASTWMDETLFSRKVDKEVTLTVLVMQRLHEEDPTGNWLNKRKDQVLHIRLPAELTDKALPNPPELAKFYRQGLLDPVRMSRHVLDDFKRVLGSYGYAGQFSQLPAPEDGGIWKRWILPIDDKLLDGMIADGQLRKWGTDWDLAYTAKEQNSASAFVESGEYAGKMYINSFGFNWHEFPQLINFMRLKRAPHYIEAQASGRSAKQTLKNRGIPAIEVPVKGGDKIARTLMATPYAEAGLVYCRASELERLYTAEKQGILMFPNNTHDDLNDALTQAIQRVFGKQFVVV